LVGPMMEKNRTHTHYDGVAETIVGVIREIDKRPGLADAPYAKSIQGGFEELLAAFKVNYQDASGENALGSALQEIDALLSGNKIRVNAASMALGQLAKAVNRSDPDYLLPTHEAFSGDFNGNVSRPWEASAIGLAERVVAAVNNDFVFKGMSSGDALEIGLRALPFMTHSEESLLLFWANMGPVCEAMKEETAMLKERMR